MSSSAQDKRERCCALLTRLRVAVGDLMELLDHPEVELKAGEFVHLCDCERMPRCAITPTCVRLIRDRAGTTRGRVVPWEVYRATQQYPRSGHSCELSFDEASDLFVLWIELVQGALETAIARKVER